MFLFLVNAAVLLALAVPALAGLLGTSFWDDRVVLQGWLLVLIPIAVLLRSVTGKNYSLAWSTFWIWSLVFLGLAPAYQLSQRAFPWGGWFDTATIVKSQTIILVAHAVILIAYALAARRRGGAGNDELIVGDRPALRRRLKLTLLVHVGIALLFMALMGSAMVSGRSIYQGQLALRESIPFFGSMYFLSTAGAIVLPAAAILLRKSGLPVSTGLIALSTGVSFAVTNPLAGSRFLTGAFLLATLTALVSAQSRRWIPLVSAVALVTIFPSTDLFRGNQTGATALSIASPSQSMLTFDFDAFEMLARMVHLDGDLPEGVPSRGELLIAPFLRWIPILSRLVEGDASGPAVARSTYMGFTNVSMPLWGEAHLTGSWVGVIIGFALLGWLLTKTQLGAAYAAGPSGSTFGLLLDIPVAALLFIVLRGSLYEVLGYVLIAAVVTAALACADHRDRAAKPAHAGTDLRGALAH